MVDLAADDRILTINTAGYYIVVAQTTYAPNGVGRRIAATFHNGFYGVGTPTVIASFTAQAVTAAGATTTAVAISVQEFAVADFISAGAFQASGAALNEGGSNNSFLTAMLISR